MNHQPRRYIVPVYNSHGDAEAYLDYPYLHNKMGEWIGWVTADRQVYSVLGFYVGEMTAEPRIVRRRLTASLRARKIPPSAALQTPCSSHHTAASHAPRPEVWPFGRIA